MKKGIMEISIESQLLIDYLSKVSTKRLVTYGQLSKLVGFEVSGGTSQLQTAKRNLIRDYDMVFDVVRGKGVVLMTDKEVIDSTPRDFEKVRRTLNRSKKKIAVVNYDKLTHSYKQRWNVMATNLATLYHFTKKKTLTQITERVKEADDKLSLSNTLKYFIGKS